MLAGLVYLEASKPVPINWFPSYDKADKIPLGTFVLHKLMRESFKDNFEETTLPPFEFLQNPNLSGNYLFVNDELNFDKNELDSLFKWASKGNNILLSANYFGERLLDTLKLKMVTDVSISRINTEPLVKLVNNTIAPKKTFHIKRNFPVRYFSKIDTLTQVVLGVGETFNHSPNIENPHINFIQVPLGNGSLFLHSQPEVFSNFFLLDGNNAAYTSALLAYINNGETLYWDNYYKSGKHVNISPLRVLLNNKYFKWAYYFVLLGVLLFIIFEGRRKQRSIPVVKPLTNKTYEYTKTIAGMYLDKKEYHTIAQKQIALFLEFIRTKLRLPTETLNQRFYKSVAERSGNSLEDTLSLFTLIEKTNTKTNTSKEELMELYQKINSYKKTEIKDER